MEGLLKKLREFDALRDPPRGTDKLSCRVLPRCEPEYAPGYADWLAPALREALAAQGIDQLYTHQADAIELIRSGQDVVLEAPTASGKTLSFAVPVIERLAQKPGAHAIMVHPMKALSRDQRRQFECLAQAVGARSRRRLETWIYDGDTDQEHRKLLRESPPPVILTNPEMLHLSFLGWKEHWHEFLRHLEFVILDEIHEYRGFFGTKVALLLRRFLATLYRLGARPQLVLATATCANPEEHAYRLTGRRCVAVRASKPLRPERHFAFIEPDIRDYQFYEIYRLRIARAALACVAHGLTTIIFCPSRRFTEEVAMRAQREAPGFGLDPEHIAPYRAGYEGRVREEIEQGLRTGRYRAVFSTNALEIGIDIGRLDACILAGFPDSSFSAWQRIGRTGRDWRKTAYTLFYAFNNPFDRFFASNIDAFLNKPIDEIFMGIDNEELMPRHLPYLVYELEGRLDDDLCGHLGQAFLDFARQKSADSRPELKYKPPYPKLDIRGAGGRIYRLMYQGREVGTISETQLFREAYLGAIYTHYGKTYRVTAHGTDEVTLEDAPPDRRTDPVIYTVTHDAEILAGKRYRNALTARYGRLVIFENFAGYRVVNTLSGEVEDQVTESKARRSQVRGFWLQVDPELLAGLLKSDALIGVEQLLRIGSPFVVPCDRHDIATFSNTKAGTIYLHETVPGGIGVAEKILELWQEILRTGMQLAEKCPCPHGCPSCLLPPRLPPDSPEPRKENALELARRLLSLAEKGPLETYDSDTHGWRPVAQAGA